MTQVAILHIIECGSQFLCASVERIRIEVMIDG